MGLRMKHFNNKTFFHHTSFHRFIFLKRVCLKFCNTANADTAFNMNKTIVGIINANAKKMDLAGH